MPFQYFKEVKICHDHTHQSNLESNLLTYICDEKP